MNFFQLPSTEAEWKSVAEGFKQWNFPHCLGAIDGKHIQIKCPNEAGSYFYNYKGTHSIVLMAIVDSNYEFLYVDVGCNGRVSDGGVWEKCSLNVLLEEGRAGLPADEVLPESTTGKKMPYTFVGDDAFPLKRYLMKPYPFRDQSVEQRIFSYRVSRTRRVAENGFGILCAKWGVFRNRMELQPDNVERTVLACVCLHNKLLREQSTLYVPAGTADREDLATLRVVPGSWREQPNATLQMQKRPRNAATEAKLVREELTRYVNEEGAVQWQRYMCGLEPV